MSSIYLADRAKQIKTKATVNEDPTDKLIRELREQNEKLKVSQFQNRFFFGSKSSENEGKICTKLTLKYSRGKFCVNFYINFWKK